MVSHDRDFLDGLVNKVFEFRNRKIKTHLGGVAEFLRSRKIESLRELEKKSPPAGKKSIARLLPRSPSAEDSGTDRLRHEGEHRQEQDAIRKGDTARKR
ncbi:MAG: hypothetical protein MZV63_69740 [Marinilabiliales bacterium]|nr:hypothetical protein [Marinilabiliales bacterium]